VWWEKWSYYIKSSSIIGITGTQEDKTMRTELQLAFSDATIRWLSHQNITADQREDTNSKSTSRAALTPWCASPTL